MSTLGLIAFWVILAWAYATFALWLAARWIRARKPTLLRALAAVLTSRVIALAGLAIFVGLPRLLNPGNLDLKIIALLAAAGLEVIGSWLVIKAIVKSSIGGAMFCWLISVVPAAGVMVLMHFVGAPYMLEFFSVPANSMAPTVVGWHYDGICPQCGQTCFVSAPDPEGNDTSISREDNLAICSACRQTSELKNSMRQVLDPDRICVNKLLRPRRWDIIEFRFPPNPQFKYIKRLVGMPGEAVFIEDGDVWINGERQALPSEMAGLKYSNAPPG
ncbi:MAG TPA: S26 family signal peptidase, partial [Gemmataceae bacterium]|nr:S26 family signal peptidase [Gemmataceae bacterium]